MLPHTLGYFLSLPQSWQSQVVTSRSAGIAFPDRARHCKGHFTLTPQPNSGKKRSGWNMWLFPQRTENSEWELTFHVKWEEEEADALCSCFYFVFLKFAPKNDFKRKSWPALVTSYWPVSQNQWLFPFSFPLLPPSSCCFCSPDYPLLVYKFQHLFSALCCSPTLSASSYIQLHHPTHSLQHIFITKARCLLRSTIFRWEGLIPHSKRQECSSHRYTESHRSQARLNCTLSNLDCNHI